MNIILETERLILREFTNEDVDNLFWLDSNPEVIRWGSGGKSTDYEIIKNQALPKMIETYDKYQNFGIWAAVKKSNHSFIGWFHYYPATESRFGVELGIVSEDEITLGYRLHPDFWGQGYATEMSKMLVKTGFEVWKVKKAVSWTLLDNHRSIRVMEKAGLKFEREFSFTKIQLPNLSESERKAVKYALLRENSN